MTSYHLKSKITSLRMNQCNIRGGKLLHILSVNQCVNSTHYGTKLLRYNGTDLISKY